MPQSSDRIIFLLASTVKYLLEECKDVFLTGAGLSIDGEGDPENEVPGVIDDLAMDTDAYQWSNKVLFFIRMLFGILNNAAQEQILAEATDDEIIEAANILDSMKDDNG